MANQHTTKSIYDFIYLDTNKIHSYYAQLTNGLPNQKKYSDKTKNSRSGKVTGGPRDFIHGEYNSEKTGEEDYEELMDMAHVLPRHLINLLDERGMIAKKLATNHLGRLVLVKGLFHMIDVDQFSDLAEPIIKIYKKTVSEEEFNESLRDFTEDDLKDFINIFKSYPLRFQANLKVNTPASNATGKIPEEVYAWMSLQEEYFTHSFIDFSLKHTNVSTEDFYVLGVLDAIPEKFLNTEDEKKKLELMQKVVTSNVLGEFSFKFGAAFKSLVGRPDEFYGVSPICIFRNIDIPEL